MSETELKVAIQNTISSFAKGDLTETALALFAVLSYNTNRKSHFPQKTYAFFKEQYVDNAPDSRFNEADAQISEWQSVDMLFQLSTKEMAEQLELFDAKQIGNTIINAYLVFTIELKNAEYSRTKLSSITREINKAFKMPVMVLFKYGDYVTLSVIHRRLNKKDSDKDVLGKVTLIKDISVANPHRAHIEILFDLSLGELSRQNAITNFVELHDAWDDR